MIENTQQNQDNLKQQRGIGLFKINYEMDVKGSTKDHSYTAGVVAYTQKEAIDTLVQFGNRNVKGFKGMRIKETSFEGYCHAISDAVKDVIVKGAVIDGMAVTMEDHKAMMKDAKKEAKKTVKKSIVPKDKK